MNLLEILQKRINELPDGDFMPGLKSVLQHIEVANRHLERGQSTADETAFTDSVYRTNQAFEGSLKEAYRVLADKNPSGKKTHQIESYLENENILRSRVLAQLTNYRQQWRNPSTHDYWLDFDEDEALLAIVTVSAFAIVLIDQIIERISFNEAQKIANNRPIVKTKSNSFIEEVSNLIEQFVIQFNQNRSDTENVREVEVLGALAGFLKANTPEINVEVEKRLISESRRMIVDMILSRAEESIIIEIKRNRSIRKDLINDGLLQISNYLEASKINQGILFIYNGANNKITKTEESSLLGDGKIIVLATE